MSTNTELAAIFNEMASILEVTGANGFRVNAHRRAGRALKELTTEVETLADDMKALVAIDGIGKGIASKIVEYVNDGTITEHTELRESIPSGLLDVMNIPGLGPKTVRLMWENADVTDIPSLQKQLDAGVIETLPRMGKKTVQNIRDSIAFMATAQDRIRHGTALPVAEAIIEYLNENAPVQRINYAGSLRRGCETIGDIDILVATNDIPAAANTFCTMPGVIKVLAQGESKCAVRLEAGIQVDLRMIPEAVFGAALMYFTGSKEHNVALRERAIKKNMRLNEYGLFKDDGEETPPQSRGVKPIQAADEKKIYQALDLQFVPPTLRECRGELDHDIPDNLITIDDVKAELHAHTIASDGRLTIAELVAAAQSRGFHTIAVTDHSKSSAQANGLDEDRLRKHIDDVHQCNEDTKGITVLAGSEVDILSDGSLDYDDDLLAALDIVVASPHVALSQDSKKATARLLSAITHPLVHIIGHPTGRLINKRKGLEPDMDALIAAAVEHNTALEINANAMRLDLRDIHVRAAVNAGGLIAINTDAHTAENFDQLRYGIMTAQRGWLTTDQCLNAWPARKLHTWLKSKR